jgi:hypothetical protein
MVGEWGSVHDYEGISNSWPVKYFGILDEGWRKPTKSLRITDVPSQIST